MPIVCFNPVAGGPDHPATVEIGKRDARGLDGSVP